MFIILKMFFKNPEYFEIYSSNAGVALLNELCFTRGKLVEMSESRYIFRKNEKIYLNHYFRVP